MPRLIKYQCDYCDVMSDERIDPSPQRRTVHGKNAESWRGQDKPYLLFAINGVVCPQCRAIWDKAIEYMIAGLEAEFEERRSQ